jgi:CelD/BcsL family acetyltransferase involved in cellulose biosynthesis
VVRALHRPDLATLHRFKTAVRLSMNTASKYQYGPVEISVRPWRDWPRVLDQWVKLSTESGASFFLSGHWVATWLEVFGDQLEPEILLFRVEQELVGACLLIRSYSWQTFLPLKRVYLNCAGENEADDTCIEYNRLLCLPGHERNVASALWQHLQKESWDEFMLFGIESQDGIEELCQGAYRQQITQKPCWYVDLAALRNEGISYEKTLSPRVRTKIRQSIRKYQETAGPLLLERANSPSEALRFLEELARLHEKTWVSRGKRGAFHSARFRQFHQQLIKRGFPEGQIEMVRVVAGSQSIGVLYSFLYQGRIYFYQCGFAYDVDKALSPGSVTHFFAIQHFLARPDVLEYDFLAGDSPYKRSLGKSQRTLEWRVAQRPTLAVKTIEALRSLRTTYKTLRTMGRRSPKPVDAGEQGQDDPRHSDA